MLRPRNRNVKAPFTARLINGAEVHAHGALIVFGITNTQENRIPLVALNVLEALDEESVRLAFVKPVLKPMVLFAELRNLILDACRLPTAEGNNANRSLRIGLKVLEDELRHPPRFFRIARPRPQPNTVFDIFKRNAFAGFLLVA